MFEAGKDGAIKRFKEHEAEIDAATVLLDTITHDSGAALEARPQTGRTAARRTRSAACRARSAACRGRVARCRVRAAARRVGVARHQAEMSPPRPRTRSPN